MDVSITSEKLKYVCAECKNENTLPEDMKPGDVVECAFCGIEYQVVEKQGENYLLELLEEEK